jgi:hypothetical protein
MFVTIDGRLCREAPALQSRLFVDMRIGESRAHGVTYHY